MTSTVITEARVNPAEAPELIATPRALSRWSDRLRASGLTLGMVPTMGALHAGHRSLIERARAECDRVVVSVFVNPTQFGPGEDLARYPRPFDADLAICHDAGVDAVFAPGAEAMYPRGFATTVHVAGITDVLEGAFRPGHFDGVATVVAKLLTAGRPHRAYFGHKDAQQCAVVRRLVVDLDLATEIVVCPTIRDRDGLALSSRNAYLSPAHRRQALAIPRSLAAAAAAWKGGLRTPTRLREIVVGELGRSPDLTPDYVAVVDPDTFAEAPDGSVRCEIVIAARIGTTRLIDVLSPGLDDPPVVDGEG